MKKFYRTSGTRFKVGDLLGGPGKMVFLHDRPLVHTTILEAIEAGFPNWAEYSEKNAAAWKEYWDLREAWNNGPRLEEDKPPMPVVRNPKPARVWIYEVETFAPPVFHSINDEWIAINNWVTIAKVVGNARGILKNHKRKFAGDSKKIHHFGTKSIRNRR